MSLKGFHVLFVTLASLLAFGFGAWTLAAGANRGLGALSFVLGVGLVLYGIWFWRKITTRDEDDARRRKTFRPLVTAVVFWLAASGGEALACSVCYGEAQGPMIDAAQLGVYLLGGLVFLLWVAFTIFFVCLWKRGRDYRRRHPGWVPGSPAGAASR